MDKTTTWMVRGAAGVFIVIGLGTLSRTFKFPNAIGNACPAGYAYAGDGFCKNVVEKRWWAPQKDLKKYGWECEKTLGLCNRGEVDWGEITEKAFTDWRCPLVEPGIGAPNSCAVPIKKGKSNNKINSANDMDD